MNAIPWTRLSVLISLAIVLGGACSGTEEALLSALGGGCLLDSDCEGELVCTFRRCHEACRTSADCPAGVRCVVGEPPLHVCLLEDERECARASDCPGVMVCGPDEQCRDECIADPDCVADQLCTPQQACALEDELVDGMLPGSEGDDSCSHDSDCEPPERCALGTCRIPCVVDEDCLSLHCNAGVCDPVPPVGPTCVPGAQEACDCATSGEGVHLCLSDGLTWGECLPCAGGTAGPCPAQPGETDPSYQWDAAFQGAGQAYDVAIGPTGEVVVVGQFSNITIEGQQHIATGSDGAFVVRYAPDGTFLSTDTFDNGGTVVATNVAITSLGEVWVTGYYHTGPGPDLGNGPIAASPGMFLLKLDAAGQHAYSIGFTFSPPAPPSGTFVHNMAVGPSDEIAIVGGYYGTVNFGLGNISSPAGVAATFLTVFNAAGANVFRRSFSDPAWGQDWHDVAIGASGNVYVAGGFFGSVSYGGATLSSVGLTDMVIAGYDATGTHLFSNQYGGVGDTLFARGIAVDATDNPVAVGFYYNADIPDFGGGVLPSSPDSAAFEVSFDAAGTHVASAGTPLATAQVVGFDTLGRAVVAGTAEQPMTLGPGCMIAPGSLFFRRDSLGAIDWVRAYPPYLLDMAVNAAGETAIVFSGVTNVDFGGGPTTGSNVVLKLLPVLP